jgi:hypothetical protein
MSALFLLALAAAAAPATPVMSNTDRIAAVCRESVGFNQSMADADTNLAAQGGDYLDALVKVRRDRAKAKYQMANLSKEQDDAVNTLCDYYLKGSLDALEGTVAMFKAQQDKPRVAPGTPKQ